MPMSGRVEIPFEQYFHHEIEKKLGPFVALGSPEDYVPPMGALREYANDDTWQQEFDRLAHKSRCIVAEVGSSDNVRWELEHVRAENLQRKLFFFSPSGQVAEMRSSSPIYRQLIVNKTTAASVTQVQELLGDDELLLSYAIGDNESFVVSVRRG